MSIKVSVIVAAHNGGNDLESCLSSIKNQTLRDIEVIMVDAASTDGTAETMKAYLSDKRFSFFALEGESISAARNEAVKKASGKYISFGDSSVIFTNNLLENMFEAAEKEKAQLCVAPMASSDVYGKHEFTSSGLLKKSRKTTKFDTNLIWNPAVTNKLFLLSKIKETGSEFNFYGKAREAAFSLPFAMHCDTIVSCNKGAASYIIPVKNEGVSPFPIEHYLRGYEYIISAAKAAFEQEIEKEDTDFGKKELKRLSVYYIDQIYHKEITVLLYSYYRHFWALDDVNIKKYADIITELYSKLSKSGKSSLRKKNSDIFYSGRLIDNRAEMAERPKVTVCVGKNDVRGRHYGDRLNIQIDSIFMQTMPTFELLVDERLRDEFPEKWRHCENIRFIHAESLGDFKQNALDECRTNYIMFQDGFARLNPKILMRHYDALKTSAEKVGFTTSPLTRFDGMQTKEYSFSDLCFNSNMTQSRTKPGDTTFALDLFFCNKLFRAEHLKGIRFSFTDNNILDMYKLYEHSRFKKLKHRGAYMPYTEEEALNYLRGEEKTMPSACRRIYKKYKSVYFKKVTLEKHKKSAYGFFEKTAAFFVKLILGLCTCAYKKRTVKNRVFFYTVRSHDCLKESLGAVYDALDCEKVVFSKALPHTLSDRLRVRKYMLTSKVIVIDGYMDYLRSVKLREGQRLVQLWYANGALKRFGLDALVHLTRLEEYRSHRQYSDVCVTSEGVRQFYAHAFGVDMEIVKASGSPKTDALLNEVHMKDLKDVICAKHPLLKNKRVYVYLPTFREDGEGGAVFEPQIDFAKLNTALEDDEVFVVGRHPLMKKDFFSGAFYSRVKDYTADPTEELLAVADVVITDYSSLVFDAALINKPTVFYCPDYSSHESDFYLDYEKEMPGEIVTDEAMLLGSIRKAHEDGVSDKTATFISAYMSACDGRSTERVCALIKGYLSQ